ncbi:EamA family transporter [Candidatus Gracilibacteria bacterium]|nr:EamA family transporter [Candidatus Gracilibacteria bacterium]
MIGIFLALVVAFIKSLGELAGKSFTDIKKNDSLDEYTLAWGTRLFSFILLLPFIFFVDFNNLNIEFIGILLASSLINAVTTITALKAVKYGDLSLVSPLTALTIPFLFVTSYFISGELSNIYGAAGVAIIFVGTYFLNIQEIRGGFLAPIRALIENLGARYMLVTAILWSVSSPLDKLGVLQVGAIGWMLLTNAVISLIFVGIMLVMGKSMNPKSMLTKKNILKIGALSILTGAAAFLQMLALKYTLVIYVIALKRASGIFSVFLGYFMYKEKNIVAKFVAAAIMLAGVLVISILGNI